MNYVSHTRAAHQQLASQADARPQHRILPAISNTDLSNLAAELLGQPRFFN